MNFLHRVGNSLARFMYGRNGVDQLNMALLVGYLLLCVVRAVLSALVHSMVVRTICDVLLLALAILIFWRMLSRDVYRRQCENRKWVGFWSGLKSRRSAARARHADKEHKYFKCKNCKTICRVPAGKGKIVITCPKCGQEIRGRS